MGQAKRRGTYEERKRRATCLEIFPEQRLYDLIRQMRAPLHKEDLITDEEYALLMDDPNAVGRLETYDEMRDEIKGLKKKNREMEGKLKLIADQIMHQIKDCDWPILRGQVEHILGIGEFEGRGMFDKQEV